MGHKDISLEEAFDNFDPSVSEFLNLNEETDTRQIFDEIVTIEERYSQNSIVNQGGIKKIFKTTDSLTNRPVAKATLINSEDSEKVEGFLREARLTAALEHPNIIPVYDIGVDDDEGPYFIMKLVGGKNLDEIIKDLSNSDSLENFSLTDLMSIFLKICDAVAYAHSKGIVHLDLKPSNIQIDNYGEVLVCDWGLAKVLNEPDEVTDCGVDLDPCMYNDFTLDGLIKGTPGYMAPEQIDSGLGPKNKQTDVYALGGVLYSLLCLKAPFESKTVDGIMKETLGGRLIPPSDRNRQISISPSLEAVSLKALRFKPEDRYTSVSELREEINKWLGGFATEAENAGFLKSAWLLMKRHKIASFLLFVLLVSSAFAFYKIKQNETIALLNEKAAKDNLELFQKQQKFTALVTDNAMSQLKVVNDKYLNNFEFRKALILIDDALRLYPEDELINTLKGELHFYLQEYHDSIKAFRKAGPYAAQEPFYTMINLAPKYARLAEKNGIIPAADLVDLTYSFKDIYRERIKGHLFNSISSLAKYKKLYNDPMKKAYLDNHMEYCRLMILKEKENNSIRAKRDNRFTRLNFRYSLDEDGINLDLSGSRFDSIKSIRHLPLQSLNLENTGMWRKWVFSHYSLKKLNIKNTNYKILTRDDLLHNGLTEVTLSEELFNSISNYSPPRAGTKKLKLIIE